MIGRALYPLRLRQRLLLVEGAFFAVVLAGVLLATMWYAESLRARIDRERLNATVSLGGEVDRLITVGATELELLAELSRDAVPLGGTWPGNWSSTIFTGGLLVIDADGRVVATDRNAADLAGADLGAYLGAASRGSAGLRAWTMPHAGQPPVLALAVPGQARRFTSAAAPLPPEGGYVVGLADDRDSAIARALRSAKLIGETGHADLIDAGGVSQLSTESDHIFKQADHPDFYLEMLGRTERTPRVTQVAHIEDGRNIGEDHVMGFEYLRTLPWAVVLGGDAAQTYAPIRALWYSVGGLASAFVAVAMGITWLGSEQLVRPIQVLTVAARQVADGELDTQLTTEVGGEIEALAESIDTMRRSLAEWGRELDHRVQLRTAELQQRTAELAISEAVAREVSSSLDLQPLMESVAATLERRLEIDGAVLYVGGGGARGDLVVGSPGVPHAVLPDASQCLACVLAVSSERASSPWHPLATGTACFGAGFRTAAVLPLRAADSQVGTMCLLRREDATAPDSGLGTQFLTLLAAEVGMGTGNALLFEDLRWREAHRRELVAKVLSAQEEERRRLARELHDGTGQSLTALLLGVDAADAALDGRGEQSHEEPARRRLAVVRTLAEDALVELRKMVLALRPTALDDLGLVPAISRYAALTASSADINISVNSDLAEQRLPGDVEIAVFRIVQEALNNVVRHSRARSATVSLAQRGTDLVVEVSDNGVGFTESTSGDPMAGVGLDGMRERAALVGGALEIKSRPGAGTTVRLTVHQGLSIGGLDAAGQAPRRAG